MTIQLWSKPFKWICLSFTQSLTKRIEGVLSGLKLNNMSQKTWIPFFLFYVAEVFSCSIRISVCHCLILNIFAFFCFSLIFVFYHFSVSTFFFLCISLSDCKYICLFLLLSNFSSQFLRYYGQSVLVYITFLATDCWTQEGREEAGRQEARIQGGGNGTKVSFFHNLCFN